MPAIYVIRWATLNISHQKAKPVKSTDKCIDNRASAKKAGRLSCRFVAALIALPAITEVSGIGSSLLVVYHEKFFILKAAGTTQIWIIVSNSA